MRNPTALAQTLVITAVAVLAATAGALAGPWSVVAILAASAAVLSLYV